MNETMRDVLNSHLKFEGDTIKELERVYKRARIETKDKIAQLNSRTDMQNLQSIVYQRKYQEAILGQIEGVLNKLQTNQYNTINDFLVDSYENGYIGMMYDFQKQTGITLLMPIDQSKVTRAMTVDSQLSSRYYKADPLKGRLDENVNLLKTRIRANLSRGIASGMTWLEVATNIAKGMNNPFDIALKDSMRIVRTEGHRVNQQGFLDAGNEAKKTGADVVKQWDSTLDDRTRPWHMEADGQIREWDEPFLVMGEQLQAPSIGGSAKNVINCRCQLLQRARWMLDADELKTLEDRARFFGFVDKNGNPTSQSFLDFKQKYLKLPQNAGTIDSDSFDVTNPYTGEVITIKRSEFKHLKTDCGEEFVKEFSKRLDECGNDAVKALYHLYGDKLRVVDTTANGAWYSSIDGGVSFNQAVVQSGNSYKIAYQNAFHEFSHMIDHLVGGSVYLTNDSELYTLIKSDGKSFVKRCYENQGYDKTPQFSKGYFLKKGAVSILGTSNGSVLGGVSDILESVSRVSHPISGGHGTSYWGSESSGERQANTGTEFMSHYMEAHCAKDGYKDAMKTVFPNACTKLEEKIWGVICK